MVERTAQGLCLEHVRASDSARHRDDAMTSSRKCAHALGGTPRTGTVRPAPRTGAPRACEYRLSLTPPPSPFSLPPPVARGSHHRASAPLTASRAAGPRPQRAAVARTPPARSARCDRARARPRPVTSPTSLSKGASRSRLVGLHTSPPRHRPAWAGVWRGPAYGLPTRSSPWAGHGGAT